MDFVIDQEMVLAGALGMVALGMVDIEPDFEEAREEYVGKGLNSAAVHMGAGIVVVGAVGAAGAAVMHHLLVSRLRVSSR